MVSPLVWVSAAAGTAALLRAGRWAVQPRTDGLGRRIRFPVTSVVAALVLALAAGFPPWRTWRLEHALSEAATRTAGAAVTVRCQGFGGAFVDADNVAGHVDLGPGGTLDTVAHVDWELCRRLRSYVRRHGADPTPYEVTAVHVLSHEARHVAGTLDEAATECQAVQRDAVTARALGATEAEARALAASYWQEHYPRMPAGYRSAECRPGGALDEQLATAPWAVGQQG